MDDARNNERVLGAPIRRLEDARFLRGLGRYVDDHAPPGALHGALLLSPHAHARILRMDTSRAEKIAGVECILTGDDWRAEKLGGLPAFTYPEDWGGPASYKTRWPILADGCARFVGDRVAFVVAQTRAIAEEAAALIEIEYAALPAVISAADAQDGARVWPDCPDNTCFFLTQGDKAATDAAFNNAAHVVSADIVNQRITANPMEPRVALGEYDALEERFTLRTASQNPFAVRRAMAAFVLNVPESAVRVISPDVGGGFGVKTNAYPEDALVLWAARRAGRPVRWTSSRNEALTTDYHSRDHIAHGELALDAQGRIIGYRMRAIQNMGAYFVSAGASPPRTALRMATSVYRVPAFYGEARCVFTNTSPMSVYRGAGRPEATILIERLLDRAAEICGLDKAEIRRRNLVTSSEMPYATTSGNIYDSGDFPAIFATSQQRADWDGFAARRSAAEKRGARLGRSITPYIEYGGVTNDRMELKIDPEGRALIVSGTHSHGQGHATAYAQLVADRLHIPLQSIRFVQGDTDVVSFGRGTYAARSSLVGGCALALAADDVLAKARAMAAHLMDARPENVEFDNGIFRVAGGNRSVDWPQVARACHGLNLPKGAELGLTGQGAWGAFPPNYPNGCHVCEIEVDPDTGAAAITRYTIVDDVGTIINPMICEGQVHGGLAQGLGQALMEHVAYASDGQLLSGTFMDYAMPRATDFCHLDVSFLCTPATTNILGVKGVGEAGIVPSPAAITNAIIDALRDDGVTDIDTPATPARIFHAIQKRGEMADAKALGALLFGEHRVRAAFHNLDALRGQSSAFVYDVQDELIALKRAAKGAAVAGYKIGLTTPRMQAMCGYDRPIGGALLSGTIVASPATLRASDYLRLGLESEIAVRFGAPLPLGGRAATHDDIMTCIDGVAAAFEIIEDRGADYDNLDISTLIADNSVSAGLVIGAVVPPQSLGARAARLRIDGADIGAGSSNDVLGHPLNAIAWLREHLAARGQAIKAGDWVTTGSIVKTQFARAGEHFVFEVAGLPPVEARIV